jgi:uncharacterized protein
MVKWMRRSAIALLVATASLGSVGALALDPPKPAAAATDSPKSIAAAKSGAPRVLGWEDLIPPEERSRLYIPSQRSRPLFDDESGPAASQEGSSAVDRSLDGLRVKLPGFIVPLTVDKEMRTSDFLLVPYFGACMHMPPPPPNQIVLVVMDEPLRLTSMYEPVWVIGTLSAKSASTELATAAYTLAGKSIEIYEE